MLFCQMFLRSFENELDFSIIVFFTAENRYQKNFIKWYSAISEAIYHAIS